MNALVPRPRFGCRLCDVPLAVWERQCWRCGAVTAMGLQDRAWLFESPVDHRFEDEDREEPYDAY